MFTCTQPKKNKQRVGNWCNKHRYADLTFALFVALDAVCLRPNKPVRVHNTKYITTFSLSHSVPPQSGLTQVLVRILVTKCHEQRHTKIFEYLYTRCYDFCETLI